MNSPSDPSSWCLERTPVPATRTSVLAEVGHSLRQIKEGESLTDEPADSFEIRLKQLARIL